MNNREYRPTIAQLRAFVTIAEHRHFSTSAARLGISQPSLSQALVALESGLNLQLIERSTRKVIVTSAGQALLPYARAALDTTDDFVAHARGVSDSPSGPITIGIIPTVAPYILPHLLQLINLEMPEVQPNIVEEQTHHLVESLKQGTIDVAVFALPSGESGLIEQHLYDEDFFLVVPEGHELAGKTNVDPKVLEDLNLLLLDDGHCLRDQVLDLCRRTGKGSKANQAVTRVASLTTVVQCVAGGLGSTLVPASALPVEGRQENIAIAKFKKGSVPCHREIGLAYRSSTSPSRGEQFQHIGRQITRAFEEVSRNANVLS